MIDIGQTGRQARNYWKDELSRATGVNQGNIAPFELPEFQGMQSAWNSNMDNTLQNAVRMLSQNNVQGGKANQMLTQLGQGGQSGLLKMIQDVYNTSYARGNQAAGNLMDLSKWQNEAMLKELALYLQKHQAGRQEQLAQNQMWTQLGARIAAAAAGGMAGA